MLPATLTPAQPTLHTAGDEKGDTQGDTDTQVEPSAASQLKTPKTSDLAGSGAGVLGGLGALFSLAGALVSLKLNKR